MKKNVVVVALDRAMKDSPAVPNDSARKRRLILSHSELGLDSAKTGEGDIVEGVFTGKLVGKGENGLEVEIEYILPKPKQSVSGGSGGVIPSPSA